MATSSRAAFHIKQHKLPTPAGLSFAPISFTMVELLRDFPDYVVAYQASGHVNQSEYETIVMNRVDKVAHRFGAMNFIVRLETGMQNYSLMALIDYVIISFKHIQHWNRMAIVSDQKTVRRFFDVLSPLVPGKIVGFELKDFEKAKTWVSQPALADKNLLQHPLGALITSTLIATSTMTLFSYILSAFAQQNFRETDLLAQLIRGWKPSLKRSSSQLLGWQAHYSLGVIWGSFYAMTRNRNRPLASSLLFGCTGGLSAIFFWKKAFDFNPKPAPTQRRDFYVQLFFAHLIFSLTQERIFLGSPSSLAKHQISSWQPGFVGL